ncbi:hypothetical protein [Butyricimonas virosa]|uniref:hypothetical protein n=1 Tax=Butyricimonas virosa TaxID=544645 RepID=UPI0015F71392|nr:hypothetical protein [Butyricimonas virosa]
MEYARETILVDVGVTLVSDRHFYIEPVATGHTRSLIVAYSFLFKENVNDFDRCA